MACLAAKAAGESYDQDELTYATLLMATATLVSKGLDAELAMRVVDSALEHGDIHVTWSEDEGLSLTFGEGVNAELETDHP